jgi:hypothetical protein
MPVCLISGYSAAPLPRQFSRQLKRSTKRSKHSVPKYSLHWSWVEAGTAILIFLASLGFSLTAWIEDARAFLAIATPSLYCWLTLCLLCVVGVVLAVLARWAGTPAPLYLRLALLAGVASGLFTLSPALQVLNKQGPRLRTPTPGAHLDLRDRTIEDTSFAERDLRGSNFSGTTFRHVDLTGADLSESDLRDTRFVDSELSSADLCGTDMRGADLRGAHGLESDDWSYVFYSPNRTLLPKSLGFLLNTLPGPIPDNGRDLLYMCAADITKRVKG